MSAADAAVVIPCRDLGRTVGEAVASVRAQTRPAAELVVVDDGSTDPHTLRVLAELAAAGVRVLRLPHRGLAAARNVGVRATLSPYVVTLDADDALAPTYLERLAARLDAQPELGFVGCAIEAFEGAHYVWTPPQPELIGALAGAAPAPSSLFRRSLFDAVGGFQEDLPLGLLEDLEFWIAALQHGFRGAVVDEPLVRYRIRRDSIHQSAVASDGHLHSMLALLERHRGSITALGTDFLLARERHVEGMREHRRHLERTAAARRAAVAALAAEVASERAALAALGVEPLDLGDLRRLTPLSPIWGLERGRPLDRHYIEAFLESHAADIRGRVLEVKDDGYSRRFGGARVDHADVLDVDRGNPAATVVADLCAATAIADDTYDCFFLTQTLHVIYDLRAALAEAFRVLRPGGVLLCTLPAASRVNCEGSDYWRFTEAAAWRLFAEVFSPAEVAVTAYGNVLTCAAFLYGIAPGELRPDELDHADADFPLVLGVRARKPEVVSGPAPAVRRDRGARGTALILAYHRVAEPRDANSGTVEPAVLRAQLAALTRTWRPLALADLVAHLAGGDVPDRSLVVTFDDGYAGVLTSVAPVLADAGVSATVFVTGVGQPDRCEPWWEILARIFADSAATTLLGASGALQRRGLATATPEERCRAEEALRAELLAAPLPDREALLAELAAASGLDLTPRESHRVLSADELCQLAALPGIAIGCHTAHHLWLPRQPREVKRREISSSREALEALLGRPVTTLAYPYGAVDRETVSVAREAGITAAVTVQPQPVYAGADPLLLPRVEVGAEDPAALCDRLRALGALP